MSLPSPTPQRVSFPEVGESATSSLGVSGSPIYSGQVWVRTPSGQFSSQIEPDVQVLKQVWLGSGQVPKIGAVQNSEGRILELRATIHASGVRSGDLLVVSEIVENLPRVDGRLPEGLGGKGRPSSKHGLGVLTQSLPVLFMCRDCVRTAPVASFLCQQVEAVFRAREDRS